jgi:hypothetical protein
MSTNYVFSIFGSVFLEQGGIPLILSTPPPSPRMVSFDWNDLVEPRLPSSAPFQIRVEVNWTNIYRCIVDEGASASILSSSVWKVLGYPKLVSASHELLGFDKCPSEYLGVLPQLPILLGGKTVLVDVIVVQGPLDFNMLLRRDYVYAMNVVVSTLFQVMHFPHNGIIVTIDQLASDNHHPNLALFQTTPLHVSSVRVDATSPQVNYVAYYPRCSIASEQEPMQSSFPSQDLVSAINSLVYQMGAWEPLLPSLGPRGIEYPSESDLVVCRSSIPHAHDSLSIDSTSPGQNLHHLWSMVSLLHPLGLPTLVCVISQILNFLQMRLSLNPSLQFIYRGRTYTMVCVFFPFGRLSKLTIEETLGPSLAAGST